MALLSNTGIRAGASAGSDEPWGTDNDGRSIRFEPDDSAYLSRTFSGGNRRKWTFSTFLKFLLLTNPKKITLKKKHKTLLLEALNG